MQNFCSEEGSSSLHSEWVVIDWKCNRAMSTGGGTSVRAEKHCSGFIRREVNALQYRYLRAG